MRFRVFTSKGLATVRMLGFQVDLINNRELTRIKRTPLATITLTLRVTKLKDPSITTVTL